MPQNSKPNNLSPSDSGNGLIPAVSPDPTQTFFPAVNTIKIAGNEMPGTWILQEATREFGWQIQKAPALSGATLNPLGDDPLTAKFLVSIWRSIDMAIFQELQKTSVDRAHAMLAETRSLNEVRKIRAVGIAVATLERGKEIAIDAAEIILQADARIGELTREMASSLGKQA